MPYSFDPFPVLTTDRLVLRQLTPDDTEDMFSLRSNPELMKYIPRPLALSSNDALVLIEQMNQRTQEQKSIIWGISLRENPALLGFIGFVNLYPEHFRAEVGYMLHGNFHRKGIIREALNQVIRYGFETMHLHTIEAITDPENIASAAVLTQYGFQQEGYFRENRFFNGKFISQINWTLFRSAFLKTTNQE
ncbi:GNAT family N-acetyltransferase [Siphonobacter sp. SORGH_AS_0500]|uniref:GNAT family N-acetyltransferase n=1 Tax=Siphonobacter sp. SORGH_AS_0500 TaxID=1864824 RepID=UPI00285D89BA|nr:GNAT family N-acetyltransferase [Siphonobacter sp. SORGH_AS_0500]MDR6195078.1 ribosomal-protein-alanine N-acetyltransferase [Siphonobacter sp. SORGH_AS_0500]